MAVTALIPRSLKFRIAGVVILLVLAATVVVTLLALTLAERDMKSVIGNQQYALLSAAAAHIDRELEAKRTLLASLAETMPAEVRSHPERLQDYIDSHPATRKDFFSLVCFDPEGRLVHRAPEHELSAPLSARGRAFFEDTMTRRQSVISQPFRSRISGLPVVLITQPVFDEQGEIALVLTGSIDLGTSTFFDEIDRQKPGRTGYMFIMTTDGILVHHPDRSRLLENINDRPGTNLATQMALRGYEGWTEAQNKEGVAGIYSYKRLALTNWIIGARFPTDEALEPIIAMRRQAMLAAAAFAAIAGVLAWLLMLALFRPLGRLHRNILDIRNGSAAIGVLQRRRADEIGELSRAFHELMAEREAAQDRTRASEALIRDLLDRAPDAFVSCDAAGIVTEWNRQAEQTFGWRRDEALGRDMAELIMPPHMRGLQHGGMLGFAQHGDGTVVNARVRVTAQHRDGHAVPIELSVGALQHGSNHYATAFLHDITDRIAYEDKIAASEKRARMIADNMPALIAYIDRDLRYRFSNERFRDMLAVEPRSVIGKTIAEVFGDEFYLRLKDKLDAVLRGERVRYEREGHESGRTLQLMAEMIPDFGADGKVAGFYLMTVDISARKNAELTLATSEKRLQLITDNLPVLISYLDQERRFQFVNATFQHWFGRDPHELIGRHLLEGIGAEHYHAAMPHLDQAYSGHMVTYELRAQIKGSSHSLETTFVPDVRADGRTVGVYSLTHDTTRMKEIEERLLQLARVDALTGIANRRMFEEILLLALGRARRSGKQLALAYLDVDHFKAINDSMGHGAGDDVLKEFAMRLVANVRITDTVARLAGDEFVIIFEQINSIDEVPRLIGKLIEAVRGDFAVAGGLHVTTSIGVAMLGGENETPAELVARADRALYAAKRNGRDGYVVA